MTSRRGLPFYANYDPDEDLSWMQHGKCVGCDPGLFFPERNGSKDPALQVCAGCPVVNTCREHAFYHHENYGVWGGTTPRQRQKIWREQRKQAA